MGGHLSPALERERDKNKFRLGGWSCLGPGPGTEEGAEAGPRLRPKRSSLGVWGSGS